MKGEKGVLGRFQVKRGVKKGGEEGVVVEKEEESSRDFKMRGTKTHVRLQEPLACG